MQEIRMIKDLGPFTLFSTVVLQPTLLGRPDRIDHEESEQPYRLGYTLDARRVAAFAHCIGQRVPGTRRAATRLDTNMNIAAQIVDEERWVNGLGWRIPARTPAEFRLQEGELAYEVTRADVREFVETAKICFYSGGDKPFYELPLAARPVVFDADDTQHPVDDEAVREDAIGSWGQRLTTIEPALPLHRLEKFWWEVQFPDRLPHLEGPLTLICAIEAVRSRGVN